MMLKKEEVDPEIIKAAKIFHFGTLSSTHPEVREATRYAIDVAKENGLLDDYNKGVEMLRESYDIPLIFVTLGKEGSRAYYKDMIVEVAPFIRKDTIETTGAGDTFEACALNYVLEHGLENLTEENLKELLRFANAGASIITSRKGALKVMPEKEEIEKVLGL